MLVKMLDVVVVLKENPYFGTFSKSEQKNPMRFILPALICFLIHSIGANAQETIVQYLSGKGRLDQVEWDFFCSDGRNSGKWTTIKVPSNWELENFGTYNYGHDHKNQAIKYGKEYGLYKHEFAVPQDWQGKTIQIVFEGAMTDTEVKINGQSAGEKHQGGFYRFQYDISDLVEYGGDNLLEVKVSKFSSNESINEAERYADYWIFGGIYRPVYLEVLPELHFQRLAVDARADGELSIQAFLNQQTEGHHLALTLKDRNGHTIGQRQEFDLDDQRSHHQVKTQYSGIQPWNPESPNMYTLQVDILDGEEVVTTHHEKIGFRTVELIPHDGIYVNGEKIVMKGVCRHSFYPTSGRCLSDMDHLEDINLMKDMNMNAVRMSHYPPDKRFLELCDSMGVFVLNELGGWQQGYDTIVGPRLIESLILRDENHPSVIIWDFGNEGGWKFPNEKWFHEFDFQKRPVVFPWLRRNHTDSRHYPSYHELHSRLVGGDQIFFPTELLHGLYDGGHGANFYDYWEAAKRNPVNAGGFLWNLRDEAVWRTDLEEYDSDGNHAPDGIVGPHGEKEGSFYTVKEVWSPVQINPFVIHDRFDGEIVLRNEFIYTNLKDCRFEWKLVEKGSVRDLQDRTVASGMLSAPDAEPGTSAKITIPLPDHFMDAEVLEFKATDPLGREIYTWRWPIKRPENYIPEMISGLGYGDQDIAAESSEEELTVRVGKLTYRFDLQDGKLSGVENARGEISFRGGPAPVGYTWGENAVGEISWKKRADGTILIQGSYGQYPESFEWVIRKDGLLELRVDQLMQSQDSVDYLGISFDYPESRMKGMQWMGDGPYRVYKNRLEGTTFNVWQKDYNNTITGESFDNLVYPEFKGYHANFYWAEFETEESDFRVMCASPRIYLKTYNPPAPAAPGSGAHTVYPEGDISFLHYIPGIGTKFHDLSELGPSARPSQHSWRTGDVFEPLRLVFDFHTVD